MKKTFACAVQPNKAPSMRRGLSIISLEHSYRLYGSRIFDRTQLAPKFSVLAGHLGSVRPLQTTVGIGSIKLTGREWVTVSLGSVFHPPERKSGGQMDLLGMSR